MPKGLCRLCKSEADLQLSHVVPAFVFRWLRESSGNGYLRSSHSPNLRVQDGLQEYWLCSSCEANLGRSEAAFATRLFHPYVAASGDRFRYGEWLLHFCASVSWRNLTLQVDHMQGQGYSEQDQIRVSRAEQAWREYLLGDAQHPGAFRQFILPLDRIASAHKETPPNANRYLMRAVDVDLCQGGESIFTYTKLGRFVIIGFVTEPDRSEWIGGMVNANQGVVEPRGYTIPAAFWSYLMERAGMVRRAMSEVSPRQRDRIDQAVRANIDSLVGSDFHAALQADVEMFGSAAFTPLAGE